MTLLRLEVLPVGEWVRRVLLARGAGSAGAFDREGWGL